MVILITDYDIMNLNGSTNLYDSFFKNIGYEDYQISAIERP